MKKKSLSRIKSGIILLVLFCFNLSYANEPQLLAKCVDHEQSVMVVVEEIQIGASHHKIYSLGISKDGVEVLRVIVPYYSVDVHERKFASTIAVNPFNPNSKRNDSISLIMQRAEKEQKEPYGFIFFSSTFFTPEDHGVDAGGARELSDLECTWRESGERTEWYNNLP